MVCVCFSFALIDLFGCGKNIRKLEENSLHKGIKNEEENSSEMSGAQYQYVGTKSCFLASFTRQSNGWSVHLACISCVFACL